MIFLWPVPIYLGAAVLLIVLAANGRRVFPGTAVRRRSFWCPFQSRNVTADIEESVWDAVPRDIARCTAFIPASAVQCDKPCLHFRTLPAIKPEAPLAGG
jgi:hypothetical protein